MNLVFFDIECASVYKTTAKICAFGYCICDEKFNIIKKEDILINPKGKFHLTDGRGEHGLVLPYEYEEFKKHPAFPAVYSQIKALLEDKNNFVLGHSTMNDVKYLDLETNRFNLPSFNFEFSDSQLLYMTQIGDYSRQFGLEYITKDLNVEFTPHRAADDAYATMKIVEEMCRRTNLTCSQLHEKLKVKKGVVKAHKISKPTSAGYTAYCEERDRLKKERAENRAQFFIFLSRKRPKKSGKLLGKSFNFSRLIEDDLDLSMSLVNSIYEHGGIYTQKLDECNHYVCLNEDTTVRTKNAREKDNLNILSVEQLTELFNG
jgi:DNA polymerase III epsilon subunit-like protein